MGDIDRRIIQHTPPPSPYLETKWDLKLDEVRDGLLHPKEKRLGYLELYFAGFMEFVEEPSSPEMSDDETEYPRWGKVRSTSEEFARSRSSTKSIHDRHGSPASDFSSGGLTRSSTIDTVSTHTDNSIVESIRPTLRLTKSDPTSSERRCSRTKNDIRFCRGEVTKSRSHSAHSMRTRTRAGVRYSRSSRVSVSLSRNRRNQKSR